MKEVLDFLTANKIFYLATTAGEQPHVRPLGFVMNYEGRLIFCTSNEKNMYQQLRANSNVEICCVDAGYNTLRVSGKAVFCTSEDAQRKALEVMPSLKRLYAAGDGKFELFYLESAQAMCQSMAGEKRVLPL